MAAPLTTEGLVWIRASNGETVDGAIVGGTSSSGEEIHIIRAHVHDELHDELAVGSLFVGRDCAYIPLEYKEVRVSDYEVLCNRGDVEIQWVHSTGKNVPTGAVRGGTDERGVPIYVARHEHEGNVVPGKFLIFLGLCYISCCGREQCFGDNEMLCVKSVTPATSL